MIYFKNEGFYRVMQVTKLLQW